MARWGIGRCAVTSVALAMTLSTTTAAQTVASADAVTDAAQVTPPERFGFHAQSTFVYQGQDAIRSPFRGPNSLSGAANARETWDVTLDAGFSPWRGAELWIDPEVDQGFGLTDTLGVAGFPSGEAYKVGAAVPYLRLQRIFLRQTVDLGGERESVAGDFDQLAGSRRANRLVFTGGKISVGDIFDGNAYAHGPRTDFLNWSVIDAGTFDYAADSWGYTAGAALEWYQGRWTVRGGAFLLSNVPNSPNIDTRFEQFQLDGEIEERHTAFGQPGKLKLTGFLSRARMGRFADALTLGRATGTVPDPAAVRRYASRPGIDLNIEQQVATGVGLFARLGVADGTHESFDFTDIDRTASGGASIQGRGWGRPDDTIGLAGVVNQASHVRLAYLAAGGLGILIGDGRLPHPGREQILEGYYDVAAAKGAHIALDYQWIDNPGYDRDRGPASVLALRLHGQF